MLKDREGFIGKQWQEEGEGVVREKEAKGRGEGKEVMVGVVQIGEEKWVEGKNEIKGRWKRRARETRKMSKKLEGLSLKKRSMLLEVKGV